MKAKKNRSLNNLALDPVNASDPTLDKDGPGGPEGPSADVTQHSNYPAHQLLHRLWTKAVGTKGYDKTEWIQLESVLLADRPTVEHATCPRCGHLNENYKDWTNAAFADIYLALAVADLQWNLGASRSESSAVMHWLNHNGFANLTCCPACHVDDFTHIEGCSLGARLDELEATKEPTAEQTGDDDARQISIREQAMAYGQFLRFSQIAFEAWLTQSLENYRALGFEKQRQADQPQESGTASSTTTTQDCSNKKDLS